MKNALAVLTAFSLLLSGSSALAFDNGGVVRLGIGIVGAMINGTNSRGNARKCGTSANPCPAPDGQFARRRPGEKHDGAKSDPIAASQIAAITIVPAPLARPSSEEQRLLTSVTTDAPIEAVNNTEIVTAPAATTAGTVVPDQNPAPQIAETPNVEKASVDLPNEKPTAVDRASVTSSTKTKSDDSSAIIFSDDF